MAQSANVKALTVWQPWASLIIAGAKRYEFRRWDYRTRHLDLVGQRIVIHAGARMPTSEEVNDILGRINDGVSALDKEVARSPLRKMGSSLRLYEAFRATNRRPPARLRSQRAAYEERLAEITPQITLAAGVGTAVLGHPRKAIEIFGEPNDSSYRADPSMWAWPMLEIEPWDEPVPMVGAQGFWTWPAKS